MERLTAIIESSLFEHSPVGLVRQLEGRSGICHVDLDQATHTLTVDVDSVHVKAADVPGLIVDCGYRVDHVEIRPR